VSCSAKETDLPKPNALRIVRWLSTPYISNAHRKSLRRSSTGPITKESSIFFDFLHQLHVLAIFGAASLRINALVLATFRLHTSACISFIAREDDDTINVRFDNHDTQWFPVGCLYREVESAAAPTPAQPKAADSQSSGLQQMTMDTIKERQYYFITTSLVDLKKAWYEAELGELDDEDFQTYLGRKVYAIDIEEDDETVNVRFDNHDSQWFPVTTLYQ